MKEILILYCIFLMDFKVRIHLKNEDLVIEYNGLLWSYFADDCDFFSITKEKR